MISQMELSRAFVLSISSVSIMKGSVDMWLLVSRWMRTVVAGWRFSKFQTSGKMRIIAEGGADNDNLRRRLMNDATMYEGMCVDVRKRAVRRKNRER